MLSWILKIVCWIIAGAVASKLMGLNKDNDRNGILVNLIIGVIGGLAGTLIAKLLGIGATNIVGSTLISIAGACAAIGLVKYFGGKKG
ncbi:MAG: GlsB/YeaQ/YmgE family stress response membrane protein [Clostridia bacterium]|nr:GlsB/YeaQ/YmgE family stress response membrane protein [Clostridia bacterium]